MLSFATRHGAGSPKFNLKFLFTPIHAAFAIMLCIGYSPTYGAYCLPNPYPKIFFVETAFFLSLFVMFRIMKRFDFFVAWS